MTFSCVRPYSVACDEGGIRCGGDLWSASCAGLVWCGGARAGTYDVYGCRLPDGVPVPARRMELRSTHWPADVRVPTGAQVSQASLTAAHGRGRDARRRYATFCAWEIRCAAGHDDQLRTRSITPARRPVPELPSNQASRNHWLIYHDVPVSSISRVPVGTSRRCASRFRPWIAAVCGDERFSHWRRSIGIRALWPSDPAPDRALQCAPRGLRTDRPACPSRSGPSRIEGCRRIRLPRRLLGVLPGALSGGVVEGERPGVPDG